MSKQSGFRLSPRRSLVFNCKTMGDHYPGWAAHRRFICIAIGGQELLAVLIAQEGRFQVLLTNPHTLAESVSLHSVCHDAVYFEYSYNLVHLLQSKDRIHRLGLPKGQYAQYTFLQTEYRTERGPWSMEGVVYQRLLQKERTMLEAIGRRKLEVLPTSEEDLEMIFRPLLR